MQLVVGAFPRDALWQCPPHSTSPSTYLEEARIVAFREVKGKALAQDPVHPALQDGRHAEPVQRELGTTRGQTDAVLSQVSRSSTR